MTEWISFKDRMPEAGDNVLLVRNFLNGDRDICCTVWTQIKVSFTGYFLTFWMPAPALPEEEPPKREVPKDGRTYLCWTGDEGACLIYWSSKYLKYLDLYLHEDGVIPQDSILRYMDEKGSWVEL